MRIEFLSRADEAGWDAFVSAHAHGTFFHRLAYRDVVRDRMGHEPLYLVAKDDGAIVGALPLFLVGSPLLGRALVSVPYGVYGGAVARDAEVDLALHGAAKDAMAATGAKVVELRNQHVPAARLPESSLYFTFVRDLPADPEACLDLIPRKSRASTRHARDKYGMTFESGTQLLPAFYDLFARNKQKLGSPVFGQDWFEALCAAFGNDVMIHGVRHEGRLVAAVFSYVHRDLLMPYYSGAVPGTERLGSMNFMYWQLQREGVVRGLKRYDFGRSRAGTGAFQFKINMGFEASPLHYQYVLREGGQIPAVNPGNPKFAGVRDAWAKLPLWVVKRIGPRLMRYLP
ncbi:MAG: FemAB family PEP-CTERM system-associated protein [Planctomycetes bacterium]|nr:FemAB family PEP-CTERM system-associated protein [Planctomycetota bacterium]